MYRDDWVSVVAPVGEEARVRAELVALAEHSGHVRKFGSSREFLIPPYLAERYSSGPAAKTEAPAPAPRARRRSTKEGDK